ncbi:bZIP transcription factor [Maudiozyma barnettii]|uniref:Similar to Saccharomyces cerevisiae YHL009C YAP3 Basic leucine zipper (BZIP) transcription factor n=1 Tax=Maudiozyma barnettii TaxID=61262 RepID=A0A8H2VK93_9SACH|nr:uncharacterized protein KABA2_12S01474 [Kazachstania barnettii]CAB4256885.1 similar to Saccharomyces cerevisiae YHL009C YAP3 Basic leucine zipper (bZIP) transcription factor [Kazachstania barnettii]
MKEERVLFSETLALQDIDSQLSLLLEPQQASNGIIANANDDEEERARKKAQNRAAQKAFRERKMARMKDLQDRLSQSEFEKFTLLQEIDQLKLLNIEIHTENQFLRKQSSNKNISQVPQGLSPPTSLSDENGAQFNSTSFSFPTKDTFFKSLMIDQFGEEFIQQRHSDDNQYSGVQLLSVPATWEYLQKIIQNNHDIEFDMIMVMNNLKKNHICAEEGPSYPIYLINQMIVKAIEASSSSSPTM